MKKQIELSRATAYTGTCAGMCPERERESRLGFQLSIFERDREDQPDKCLMVKEYRRAGADQEEPAPADLRTPRALKTTMDHLVCNVMDDSRSLLPDIALEWYDFLWDRLRAIRKDITQQNICDQSSALLVERCTRFHVHSCYAMNHVKDFDVDMNKRNLNDCLQMLRQMYNDLKNEGITCPGELEFQKYNILLHLDEDPLSTTVLMKTSDHRNSLEMKFIIQIFNSYLNNDYYRFFQLMQRADYMTSCILSLYVNRLRLKALKIMLSSCTSRQMALYPAELVIETLGFDDLDDLANFLSTLEIQLQEKNAKNYLSLNKDLIRLIDRATLGPFKSRRLVENKMCSKTIGGLVYGDDKPETPDLTQDMDDENDSETYSEIYSPEPTNNLYARPKLDSCLQDISMKTGEKLEFCIKSTGLPPIDTCQWFKNNELIIELTNLSTTTTSSTMSKFNERICMSCSEEWQSSMSDEDNKVVIFKLCIGNLKLDDTGRYKCRIINEFGYDETDCVVKVLQEIIEEHEEIEETIEETRRLSGGKKSSREEAEEIVVTEEQLEESREDEKLSVKCQRQEAEEQSRVVDMTAVDKKAPCLLRVPEDTETLGDNEEPSTVDDHSDDSSQEDDDGYVKYVKNIQLSRNGAEKRKNSAKIMPAGRFRRKTFAKAPRSRQQPIKENPLPLKQAIWKPYSYNKKLVDMQQAIKQESKANEKLLELIKVFIQ